MRRFAEKLVYRIAGLPSRFALLSLSATLVKNDVIAPNQAYESRRTFFTSVALRERSANREGEARNPINQFFSKPPHLSEDNSLDDANYAGVACFTAR